MGSPVVNLNRNIFIELLQIEPFKVKSIYLNGILL